MNVLFCGGGTLGHIYPAISLLKAYHSYYPSDTIFLLCNEIDEQYVKQIDIPYLKKIYIESKGLTKNLKNNLLNLLINIKACKEISKILKENNIKEVYGMGGYISGIVIFIAKKHKIKTIIHEQNSVMGIANKLSAHYANYIFATFPLKLSKKYYLVGNPRYEELKIRYQDTPIAKIDNYILFTSGTLGAKKINELAVSFINSEVSKNYYTILITGKKYYQETLNKIKYGKHYEILPFTNNLVSFMEKAKIIIMRSGSTTIFESLAMECYPIYIPSPNVKNNHQYFNALTMVKKGVGVLIEESQLNLDILIKKIKYATINYYNFKSNLNNIENIIEIKKCFEIIKGEIT